MKVRYQSVVLVLILLINNPSIARGQCVSQTVAVAAGSASQQVFTDLSLYMLNGLSPDKSCSVAGPLKISCAALIQDVCDNLLKAGNSIAYDDLRTFYHQRHNETISVRGHQDYVKPTLAELKTITNYMAWERRVVAMSGIKRKTRVIYRSPPDYPVRLSVAETLDCTDGNLNAPKLETEITVKRKDGSGNFEFYAYDVAGNLAQVSHFPAGERPSPTVCVACHYDGQARTVSRFTAP